MAWPRIRAPVDSLPGRALNDRKPRERRAQAPGGKGTRPAPKVFQLGTRKEKHRGMPPHPIRRLRKPIANLRFWEKVVPNGDCWEWTGQRKNGYGIVDLGPRQTFAHRYAYEQLVGPIPAGKELDHLCRNTICVNPDHNEPVSHAENVRRGVSGTVNGARGRALTVCKRGLHPFDLTNTHVDVSGRRRCKRCHADRERAAYRRAHGLEAIAA